jgi:hypothetical protein
MRAVRFSGVLAAAFISGSVLNGPGIGSAATGSPAVGAAVACGPGSVLWTSVRAGLGHAVAADPSGGMVFAVGSPSLIAYNAGTGAKLWENVGSGRSVAVSRNGHVVFVIKPVGGIHGADFLTAAFDAATGKRLWARRYNGRANGDDRPVALAVSPGGRAVFVTGISPGKTSGRDYATVAYAVATGRRLWVSRYNGHSRGSDTPAAIAVSRGGAVLVTGTSPGRTSGDDFATVAYAAGTGAPLWTKRYNGPANGLDAASSVMPSRDGHRVFVTGTSDGRRGSGTDIATIAYAAGTGAPLWVRRYHGPTERNDIAVAVLASAFGGGTVITAGDSAGNGSNDYVSVAYIKATGQTKWVSRIHRDVQPEFLEDAAISPDGRSFYLTGYVFPGGGGGEEPSDVLTVAANVSTGAQRWAKEIAPTIANGTAAGLSVAVNPDSGAVYNLVQEFTTRPVDFITFALQACN